MENESIESSEEKVRLPLLPLKDTVIFPHMVVPLLVGRTASLEAVDESLAADLPLLLCTQRDAHAEDPGAREMYRTGVASKVLQTLRMPDGTLKVVVEGLGRAKIQRFHMNSDYYSATVKKALSFARDDSPLEGLTRLVVDQFSDFVQNGQRVAPEIFMSIQEIEEPDRLADTMCGYLPIRVEERQKLLECLDVEKRLEMISMYLVRENELLDLENNVRERVRQQMERGQREHYLHEQMRIIRQELGQREEGADEFTEMRQLIEKAKMPKSVREKVDREFARYERMPPMSPESSVIRLYLEWLCDMPWEKRTKDTIDLAKARKVLDEDHYGLDKVKERILEFLAVRKLRRDAKGPILCLVGPPGVGKTSLGQSIARAMNREFVRISLGGVRDEAEIRGHRRTYIGALPGRIIQSMKKAGVRNPTFMLDEIDKMSTDFRGDPASALLEVLDPAQNKDFSDHYLEVEFDLSEVFFVATANSADGIPYALYDRLEIVRLAGYTQAEKEKIAELYLIPRQLEASGLQKDQLRFTTKAMDTIIQRYTREAGVRELERQIANVCRKSARKFVEEKKKNKATQKIDESDIQKLLGPWQYTALEADIESRIGVAVGMAYTGAGGDILSIETSVMGGKGKLQLTGQLGDVMKESAQAAYTYLRAHAAELAVPDDFHKESDIHVHVPEGATPKDGPSAGVALFVSMLSALTGKAPAPLLSMTGEITLRGRVLAVGGIKEKVLAAHRAGIRRIMLPKENEKDFPDIPKEVLEDIDFTLVDHVSEVLPVAFPGKAKA